MNLAILHYHLNRGGVTRVIVNHLRSLAALASEPMRVLVLHGGRTEAWPRDLSEFAPHIEVHAVAVPGLDYDELTPGDAGGLAEAVHGVLRTANFEPASTVLHVHNHSLGKNRHLPAMLASLAREGFGLLLHVHDFPEDFRPANYDRMVETHGDDLPRRLYPDAPRSHFAALNRRDLDLLAATGITSGRRHFLPNPVPLPHVTADRATARADLESRFGIDPDLPYLLAPVRGIRRKNVGEAVLWSALLAGEAVVGITLAPLNPVERAPYDEWTRFADGLDLPIRFGVGEDGGLNFEENVVAADAVLATSVTEGFGMAFLEPWTFERPLVGRNLPEITADFVDEGLDLDGLYERLPVPVEWVGRANFATRFRTAVADLAKAFNRRFSETDVDEAIDRKCAGGNVDFGDLDEPLQRAVIERVVADAAAGRALRARLPPLLDGIRESRSRIERNRRVVEDRFSPLACGRRLLATYESILAEPPPIADAPAAPQSEAVLDTFLALDRLRLLRC